VKLGLLVVIAALVLAAGLGATLINSPDYRSLVRVGPTETIMIRNARVFTATGSTTLEGHDVVIENGKIARVDPTSGRAPAGARIIDGTNKTLLPGLIDFHIHTTNSPAPPWHPTLPSTEHNLASYLYAGVTTVVSMGDDIDKVREIKDQLRRGVYPGPRMLYAGMPITKMGGHPQAAVESFIPWPLLHFLPRFSFQIESPSDAEGAVQLMADGGAHHVKVVVDDIPSNVPKLDAEHIKAVVEAARRRNLKVAAHIGRVEDALVAAKSGVHVLNHGIHRGSVSPEQAEILASAGVACAPTLIIFERLAQFTEAKMNFDSLDRAIQPKEVLAQFSPRIIKAHREDSFMRPWFEEVLRSRDQQLENAVTLYRAGVPIFVGTDSSIFGNIAGASIHQEMALLVKAGIPAREVLLGATSRPAAFLFERPEIGTIEPGKIAELVLVNGNPMEDIRTTRDIAAVIQAGRIVERHAP
jgi:imidazolonepropionase-like amidohydrolase